MVVQIISWFSGELGYRSAACRFGFVADGSTALRDSNSFISGSD